MARRKKESVCTDTLGDKLETTEKTPVSDGVWNTEVVPPEPEPAYTETKYRIQKLPEGLIPIIPPEKEIGEVPMCMCKKRAADKKAQAEYDQYVEEMTEWSEQEALERLNHAKRQKRLHSLKAAFNDHLYEYQSMSLVIDTIRKRQKRLFLEKKLNQLEEEIKQIEEYKGTQRERPMERGYDLTTEAETPLHISKYREQVKQEKLQSKEAHQTMGVAKVEVSPDKYLLKHSKEPKLPEKKPFSYTDVQPRKPPIPPQTIQPHADNQPPKDFIKYNVLRNIMSVPRKPEPAYAKSRHGHTALLENSGLVPKYSKKKDFGNIPAYMRKEWEANEKAQEENYNRYMKEKMQYDAMMERSENERQTILHGLKTNFKEYLKEYQSMPLKIDTISNIQKRVFLEKQMNQLEKDINLVEKSIVIDTSDDSSGDRD